MSHFNMQYFTDKINSNIFPLSFLEKHLSKRKIIYRFSQAACLNALPWPGLEPGSSDLEPSALTTGLQSYGHTSKFFSA